MEREYIKHLEKTLEETQKILKEAVERVESMKWSRDHAQEELEKYKRYWREEMAETKKVREELEAQKKEQEVAASNSSDNLKEAI
nr:hypothetical protein [uncultured Sphaerochaeta sp.]